MMVFLNGAFVPEESATVSVFDRGFLYGDGLFETIRVHDGRPFRWAQHCDRLQRGAAFLGIRIPYSPLELRDHLTTLLRENQQTKALVRINLSRGIGPRGYSPRGAVASTLAMTLHPAPFIDPATPPRWRLMTSSHRLPTHDPLAPFKTTHKLLQVLARAEAEGAGADDALLLNTDGEVTETTSANIFWVYRETLHTTPSDRGALPGITRAAVLELSQTLGIPTNQQPIKPEALHNAEGVFLTLSSHGLVPVSRIDDQAVDESPLRNRLCGAYWEAVARA